jgi:hypothetical protein
MDRVLLARRGEGVVESRVCAGDGSPVRVQRIPAPLDVAVVESWAEAG